MHLRAAGLFEPVSHPSEGLLRAVRSPFRARGPAKKADRPAPTLGDSSEAILREAGFSAADVANLLADGVVMAQPAR